MTPPGERHITGFHAHVYFNATTLAQARRLCEDAARRFAVQMGRVHEHPIGPHPDCSCQLAFGAEVFGELIPWLALHRDGLVVFVHPLSGNELLDHRDHALWMGEIRPLDLSVLSDREQ
jgi:aromatic ring-cleaving dioxygenase